MRLLQRAWLPSVITVGVQFLNLHASAAETVTVPDGSGSWQVRITPRESGPAGESAILMAAFEDDTESVGIVPDPVELGAPGELAAPASLQEENVAPDGTVQEYEAAPEASTIEPSGPAVSPPHGVDPAAYWCVYRTIPFLRTEYEANPSYRHEATMEFLFGQLRPTVVHKHQNAAPPAPVVRPAPVAPWVYDIYMGQIPTFMQRYRPPAIPFGYPLTY